MIVKRNKSKPTKGPLFMNVHVYACYFTNKEIIDCNSVFSFDGLSIATTKLLLNL